MYGEELRPDQMSMSRTFEAVWMMPLQNPNEKEISCKSGMGLNFYSEINHLHEEKGRSMRQKGSAKASRREAESKSEVARGAREAVKEKSSCH